MYVHDIHDISKDKKGIFIFNMRGIIYKNLLLFLNSTREDGAIQTSLWVSDLHTLRSTGIRFTYNPNYKIDQLI